jgi:hypothetical protein
VRGFGIEISKRELGPPDSFHEKAREVLRAGLASAAWITVDDTGMGGAWLRAALGAPLRVKTHAAPAASKGPPTMAVLPSTLIVRPNELLFRFALGRGVAAVGNRCSDLTVLDQVFEDETLCRIAEVPEETRRACNEARP